jgi:hypothetical protein
MCHGGLLIGWEWFYRTQRALSVEAAFLGVLELSEEDEDEDEDDESDFALSVLGVAPEPLAEPFAESLLDEPESPLSEVIDDEDDPRLSVL